MTLPEVIASTIAAILFALALLPAMFYLTRESRIWSVAGTGLTAGGLIALTAGIAVRWADLGHPPVFGSFENSLAAAWTLGVGTLLSRRSVTWRHLWLSTLPWAAVILAWGQRFNTNRIPLTISEQSVWVDVHVVFSWVAYFAFTALLTVAVLAILRGIEARRNRSWRILANLPSQEWADEMLVQSSAYSFVGITGVILTGAFYSWQLFGMFWRWDVVEVLAMVVWLLIGLTLHLRLFFGWRGISLAVLSAVAYVGALLMYWGLALFPFASYHYFELPF